MLTLKRFRILADSFGGDLRRWPEVEYAAAKALLASSAEARRLLLAARRLDLSIGAASTALGHGQAEAEQAALARLRATVAARIATTSHRGASRFGALQAFDLRRLFGLDLPWIGVATGGGAVAAGLVIGALYGTPPQSPSVLALLQPAPIHILAD